LARCSRDHAVLLLEKLVLWRHCHTHDCEAHGMAAPMVIIGDAFHNFLDGVVIGTPCARRFRSA
jgi:zinc transporter ZupT